MVAACFIFDDVFFEKLRSGSIAIVAQSDGLRELILYDPVDENVCFILNSPVNSFFFSKSVLGGG